MKERLDNMLVARGLAESREKAKAIIMSGIVYVDDQKEDKAGTKFEETVRIEVRGHTLPYVSRGGLKLEKAMTHFGVKPEGKVCMDVGASTGGFTGQIVCLIKPQFEAGREKVGKKGVVREKSVHLEVIETIMDFARGLGFSLLNLEFSPIKGPEGNIEYLLYLDNRPDAAPEGGFPAPEAVVGEAHGSL